MTGRHSEVKEASWGVQTPSRRDQDSPACFLPLMGSSLPHTCWIFNKPQDEREMGGTLFYPPISRASTRQGVSNSRPLDENGSLQPRQRVLPNGLWTSPPLPAALCSTTGNRSALKGFLSPQRTAAFFERLLGSLCPAIPTLPSDLSSRV